MADLCASFILSATLPLLNTSISSADPHCSAALTHSFS